ncbi:MAG: DUF1465 family protein [Alphaproteobacteria bacterium]|nr:DUF1465 family protein [Alphaproteobacteria bacterium]
MPEQINHASVTPFEGPYREVLSLLEQARDYAKHRTKRPVPPTSANGSGHLISVEGLRVPCEALRVTTRLSQCLAWLLLQKAIQHGELPPEAALRPENRLDGVVVCEQEGGETDPATPEGLRDLLERSRRIYAQVKRLDAGLDAVHQVRQAPEGNTKRRPRFAPEPPSVSR